MITLTANAEAHIKSQLESRGQGIGVRFGVKGAGCGGYSYTVEFVDSKEKHDNEYVQNDVHIFVDPKSLLLINGMEVDFETDGFNSGLAFKNPLSAIQCGCGESFSI